MTRPITVAHLITKLELGGAQQNTLFTVAHLDPARFRPLLITGEPGVLDPEARALSGVEFHQVPSLIRRICLWRDIHALFTLTALLTRLKPTIVHTHSSKAGMLGRVAARLAGVPIIIHSIHGFGITPDQPWPIRMLLIALERWVGSFTTKFFAVSEANRKTGLAWKLFSPDRCVVIRSGVDLEAIRKTSVDIRAKKIELGLDPALAVVGMIAPMKPQKAPLDFVRLAALVHRVRPEARFIFVGDGELREAMEAEVQRYGLRQVLHLVGWRRDIAEILRCL
ncbi:MAG: hypothetical protein EPO64_13060, partial [Nitrospirae bacterium]